MLVATVALPLSAAGAVTPAWSYVPASQRAALAVRLGGSLYLPGRTPLFYRYRSGARVAGGVLTVRFIDRVRVRKGLWRWTGKSFLWQVRPLPAGADCRAWGGAEKTFQLAGNKVYWSAAGGTGEAWRCVVDARGRGRVLVALDGGALPDVALGVVAASGLDVAPR